MKSFSEEDLQNLTGKIMYHVEEGDTQCYIIMKVDTKNYYFDLYSIADCQMLDKHSIGYSTEEASYILNRFWVFI